MANLRIGTKNSVRNKEVVMIYDKTAIVDVMDLASLDTTPPKLEIHIIRTTSTVDEKCSEKKVCTQNNKKIIMYVCSIHFAYMSYKIEHKLSNHAGNVYERCFRPDKSCQRYSLNISYRRHARFANMVCM